MSFTEELKFLNSYGLSIKIFGKDLTKNHRGPGECHLFVVITKPGGDRLHYRDKIPNEDLSRLEKWIRCGDPTGLHAEWREVYDGHSKWKAYLAGEKQEIDCSTVVNEMFVHEEGKSYTYALDGEELVKIDHPNDYFGLSNSQSSFTTREASQSSDEHSGKLSSEAKGFSMPSGLTTEEQDLYSEFDKINPGDPTGLVWFTDLGKDLDDLAAIPLLKELDSLGYVRLEAVITNLEPSRKRAIYGRVNLDSLGLQHVPIGVGTKGTTKKHKEYPYEFDSPLMLSEKTFQPSKHNFFEDGFELLDLVFKRAIKEDRKVNLLLISSLTDIAEYTDTEDGLKTFQKAVGRVIMQGGYSISAEGIPIPRDDAANNTFDMPAAERFHPRLENIPSVVYTKVAAYATIIPSCIFDDLGETKHAIGKDLQKRYQRQGVQFYKTACGPEPVNNLTQEKYLRNHCSFYEMHPPGSDTSEKGTPLPEDGSPFPDPNTNEIIPYLRCPVFDALPALATGGDEFVNMLRVLDAESMAKQTSIHKVVGTAAQDGLPANPDIHSERMAFVISTMMKVGLRNSRVGPGSDPQ